MKACELHNVSKFFKVKTSSKLFKPTYKQIEALKNICLEIPKGQCTAILGRNGAGKTTLIRLLTGILEPSTGYLRVLGKNPWFREKDFLLKIGLFSGGRFQLSPEIPAVDSLELSRYIYSYSKQEYQLRLKELAETLGIGHEMYQPPRQMSLGQRMRLELLYVLLHRPQILFLDEPTIGLDLYSQKKIREFLVKLVSSQEVTIILTSHNLKDIEECASNVAVLQEGVLTFSGTVFDLKNMIKKRTIVFTCFKEENIQKIAKYFSTDYDEENSIYIPTENPTQLIKEVLEQNFPVDDIKILEPSFEDAVMEVIKC